MVSLRLALGVVLAASGTCFAQTGEFIVTKSGKTLGTAKISQRLLSDGKKRVELVMELANPGQSVLIHTISTFKSNGEAERKVTTMSTNGGPVSRDWVVSFDEKGANVVSRLAGAPKVSQVPLVGSAPRKNPAEFWFLRDHPKVGAVARSYTFNVDRQEWELCITTFVRTTPAGNELELDFGTRKVITVVDSRGLPVTISDDTGLEIRRAK